MIPLSHYPIPHSQVAGRVIDNEAVLILSQSGEVEVLNEVGARIWELADGTRSVGDIVAQIVSEFAVTSEQAAGDVVAFIAQLAQENVVMLAERPQSQNDSKAL